MRLDVYPTDAEAFEAAAAIAAEALRASGDAGDLAVALAGGRSGRGIMVALAGRGDLPWPRLLWFWGDERCVGPDDPHSNVRLARASLFVPRGVAGTRIVAPAIVADDAARSAADYGTAVATRLGATPVFDVLFLGVGARGEVASLAPGAQALRAQTPFAAVLADETTSAPRLARITLTPPVVRAARHVVVLATGDTKAKVVAEALREPIDPLRIPAQLVLPSERVHWVVDRAAAAGLLRDARQVQDEADSS